MGEAVRTCVILEPQIIALAVSIEPTLLLPSTWRLQFLVRQFHLRLSPS